MNDRRDSFVKKPYTSPEIVYSEKLTSRAVVCVKADTTCEQQGGPILS
jgi:hypothetical protein